jgi:hypothetical protein
MSVSGLLASRCVSRTSVHAVCQTPGIHIARSATPRWCSTSLILSLIPSLILSVSSTIAVPTARICLTSVIHEIPAYFFFSCRMTFSTPISPDWGWMPTW